MKLYNERLEKSVLYAICESSKKYQGRMLSAISDEHFYSPPANEAAKRLLVIVRKSGEIPSWVDICSDPVISEESRRSLSKFEGKSVKSTRRAISYTDSLHKFYQLRKIFGLSEKINESLLKDNVDVESLLDQATEDLNRARVKSDTRQEVFHLGKGFNMFPIVEDILEPTEEDYLPTGFKAFDEQNAGISYGSLMVLAGSTSGGKTLLAIQLLLNMAKYEPCVYVPLEMTEKESMQRILANIGDVSILDMRMNKLTEKEKARVRRRIKRFSEKLAEDDSRYSIMSPEDDMRIDEILLLLKPYGYRVVVIDYISLLKGVDGDDSWKQLGAVARFCKIYAKKHNIIIILLAQANEEGGVRYAKSIFEHANNAWSWVANSTTREAGIMPIKQVKARNQILFDFTLGVDIHKMQVFDVDSESVSYSESPEDDAEVLEDITEGRKK